jgi:hypothetical protein
MQFFPIYDIKSHTQIDVIFRILHTYVLFTFLKVSIIRPYTLIVSYLRYSNSDCGNCSNYVDILIN